MKLLVVGAGEMGRWVADTVDAAVAFCDADASVAADAAASREARHVPTDSTESFDAVCLAVPMSTIDAAVEQYAPLATDAIFDVSGVMGDPLAAMDAHAPESNGRVSTRFSPRRGSPATSRSSPQPTAHACSRSVRQ